MMHTAGVVLCMMGGMMHMADGTVHMADEMMHMMDETIHMAGGVTVLTPLLPLQSRLRLPRLRPYLLFSFPYLLHFPCLSPPPSPPCLNVNGSWPPILILIFCQSKRGIPTKEKLLPGIFFGAGVFHREYF